MRILAISGSLRADSANKSALQVGKKLDVTGILANEEMAGVIRSCLVQFAATIAKEEACHV